jgi:hypothetical protein
MANYTMPKNSANSSKWAMNNLKEWLNEHNDKNPVKCPISILSATCSKDVLNQWLCVYINETRNQNGEPYPPKSIYALLCGILREMRIKNPLYPNFLKKDDPDFVTFHNTLDNVFKSLRSNGIGVSSSATEGLSNDDEGKLWDLGVLNVTTPLGLLRAVFFYCGKCFCLRGGAEHRNLALSQLERGHEPDKYIYQENSSKNRHGGIGQMRLEHKVVTIVANSTQIPRCPVYILDLYISKLPSQAHDKDLFYVSDSGTWYTAVPKKLELMVKRAITAYE